MAPSLQVSYFNRAKLVDFGSADEDIRRSGVAVDDPPLVGGFQSAADPHGDFRQLIVRLLAVKAVRNSLLGTIFPLPFLPTDG